MQLSELIGKYVEIRDKKAEIKAEYDAKIAKIDAVLDKIECALLASFQQTGTESVKTDSGTAYIVERNYCTAADKSAFLDFVKDKDEWGLLEIRPMKSAVETYKSLHNDLPPGLNWRSEVVVNIRRSN
jgi:hypothetical protein